MACVRAADRWHGTAAGDSAAARCPPLRRLLSAGRRDCFLVHRLDGRRAVRQRQHAGRQFLSPGSGRLDPPVVFRSGAQLVPDGAGGRSGVVSALGVHGHAAQPRSRAVQHESGRHGPAGVLRQQLVLAQLAVLRPPGSGTARHVCGHRRRASRRAADGRIGAVRHGARPARDAGSGPADSGPRPCGPLDDRTGIRRHDDLGQSGRRLVAQVPASLPAE